MKLPSNHRLSIRLYIWQSALQNYAAANCLVFFQFVQCARQRADVTCRICRCHLPNLQGKLRFPALGSCKARFYGVPAPLVVAARGQPSAKPKDNVLAVLNLNKGRV
jgi:hypothetical protein